jgi:hypothetical protein
MAFYLSLVRDVNPDLGALSGLRAQAKRAAQELGALFHTH